MSYICVYVRTGADSWLTSGFCAMKRSLPIKSTMLLKFSGIQVYFSPQIRLEGNVKACNAELPLFSRRSSVIVHVRKMSYDVIRSFITVALLL
jgi:hypothetical protein